MVGQIFPQNLLYFFILCRTAFLPLVTTTSVVMLSIQHHYNHQFTCAPSLPTHCSHLSHTHHLPSPGTQLGSSRADAREELCPQLGDLQDVDPPATPKGHRGRQGEAWGNTHIQGVAGPKVVVQGVTGLRVVCYIFGVFLWLMVVVFFSDQFSRSVVEVGVSGS